jgi:hypothetical protein
MSEHDTEVGISWGKILKRQQLIDFADAVKDSLSARSILKMHRSCLR